MKNGYLNDEEASDAIEGLSGLKKENPFKVPEGYFDSLSGEIVHRINYLPDLEKISKENSFSVPDGYFDTITPAVQERIAGSRRKSVLQEWISTVLRPKYSLSFAALAVLIFIG